MKKKIKFIILLVCVFLVNQIKLSSEEFYFEGEEIQILDEGNKLISKNGVKITTNTDLIFEGKKQPSGYTEPLLHQNRLKKKLL